MTTNTPKETKQQWELIASPGHVLLARVDTYRFTLRSSVGKVFLVLGLYFVIFFGIPVISVSIASMASGLIEKTLVLFSSSAPETSEAAFVNVVRPRFSRDVGFDKTTLPKLITEVAPAMESLVKSVQKGEKFSDCDFNKKITDDWSDGIDMTPKCRYSKDLTRIWVWSVVLDENGGSRPFFGLVAKRDGKTKFYNVDILNTARIPDKPLIKLSFIPRTVAEDFPELI